MLPSSDWYLIPVYTNRKLPSIFVIVLHREFLFPLPVPCLQTSCPAALWPLRMDKPTESQICLCSGHCQVYWPKNINKRNHSPTVHRSRTELEILMVVKYMQKLQCSWVQETQKVWSTCYSTYQIPRHKFSIPPFRNVIVHLQQKQ